MHSLSRFVSFIPLGLAVLLVHSQPAHASCTPGPGSDFTGNTCIGADALSANVGQVNTAVGRGALTANTIAESNSAFGAWSLSTNTTGQFNTAIGSGALLRNQTGSSNTAVGRFAGYLQTGSNNTSIGFNSAYKLETLTPIEANLKTGSNNIAIGANAGADWTTGSNNIAIGSNGVAADLNAIRIGTPGVQTRTFIAGIRGAAVARRGSSTVLIDATGQLGTVRSALRYKEQVQPMGDASSALLELRPVTFHYKEADADGTKPIQYGLIAEEVEQVMPDLVVRNEDGAIETVAYHLLPSLLLNEYQKQNRELVETRARLETMEAELAALRLAVSRLAALPDTVPQRVGSARLEIRQATE